ncbi:12424_t:CDS:1, partial [Ambispora gerdemannii]
IATLFFALAWTSPIPGPPVGTDPLTPGDPIQVTAPSVGTYQYGSWQ